VGRQGSPTSSQANVGDAERWLSIVGGGVLGVLGLSRGSLGGFALAAIGGSLLYRGLTGHCSLYHALNVNTAEPRGPATSVPAGYGVKVDESILINRPPAEVYRFWRNFENLGRIMPHLQVVQTQGSNRSHWVARGPLGYQVEWDAEVHNDRENELIAWRSLPNSEIETAGSVHFQDLGAGRGTQVRVILKYNPPAGKAGAAIARFLGQSPEQQIREDLQRFKQLMESGSATSATAGQTASQSTHS